MLNVVENPATGKTNGAHRVQSESYRAHLWLEDLIEQAQSEPAAHIIALTPAMAAVLLERNPENRRLGEADVEKYIRDMENGLWRFNGEAMIVSRDGFLNDGQHRCAAVVATGHAIKVVLVVGVDRETRMTLDQGRTRTAGDYLAMQGHVNTMRLAAATGFIWQHDRRRMIHTSGKPTKSEILAFLQEHEDIVESVHACEVKGADAYGGRSMLAFCHWVFWKTSSDKSAADDFVAKLCKGDGLLSRDPILYCRNRMVQERGRLRGNDRAELLIRTWNAHRRGDTPKTLPIHGGALPVVEK